MGASTRKQKKSARSPRTSVARAARSADAAGKRGARVRPFTSRRVVEVRPTREGLRISIELARKDYAGDPAQLFGGSAATPVTALLDLPLKQALARLVDDFTRTYCARLMAIEDGDLGRVARRAMYSDKGMRDMLRRVGLWAAAE